MNIPLDKILPNPEQPRGRFDPDKLRELSESIREEGVIQPITVEQAGDDYILHDGERRVRAAKMAGLSEIPAHVMPPGNGAGGMTRLLRALVANLQREDLNPIEEAQAFARLIEDLGLSQIEVARRTGKSQAYIESRLILIRLPGPVQALIAQGRLQKERNLAQALLDVPSEPAQIKLAQGFASQGVKIKAAIKACQRVTLQLNGELDGLPQHRPGRPREFESSPALDMGAQKAKADKLPPPKWGVLYQLGKAPPWLTVNEAAMQTCDSCSLRPVASESICSQCPAVELLRRLMEATR